MNALHHLYSRRWEVPVNSRVLLAEFRFVLDATVLRNCFSCYSHAQLMGNMVFIPDGLRIFP